MRTENIFEAYFGVLLAALTVFIIIALLGYLQKLSNSKKATTPEERAEAMDQLFKSGAISKKEYNDFFENRKHHQAYDNGEISVEELERRTDQDFSYLKK